MGALGAPHLIEGTTMSSTTEQRPGSVTAVVILTWLAAVIDIAAGALLVFFSSSDTLQEAAGYSATAIAASGWTSLVIGILIAIVALRLGKGGSGARMLISLLMAVRSGAAIWIIVTTGSHGITEAVITIAVSAIVLYLLWRGPADDWFAASSN
jgi:hypothetical protein